MLSNKREIKIRKIMDLLVAFFLRGCESCSLTLREDRRLRVIEKRVLRGVFDDSKNVDVCLPENEASFSES
jgi:hypothetical protein